MSRELLLLLLSAVLVIVAIVAALPAFRPSAGWRWAEGKRAGQLSAGIFLGVGLLHMMPDAVHGFVQTGNGFAAPFLIAGSVMILLAWLEGHGGNRGAGVPPLLVVGVLTAHSLLAGASLGAMAGRSAMLILFVTLIAHKGAASFALAKLLSDSDLERRNSVVLQAIFVLALPIGAIAGAEALTLDQEWPLVIPTILALGGGTFLHFGTVHWHFSGERHAESTGWPTALGFALMAAVALLAHG